MIPEIDIPGHTRAALASYPNLSCKGYPFRVSTHWGFHKDVLCVGKEEVFEFIQNVLKEIIELFPSKIIPFSFKSFCYCDFISKLLIKSCDIHNGIFLFFF